MKFINRTFYLVYNSQKNLLKKVCIQVRCFESSNIHLDIISENKCIRSVTYCTFNCFFKIVENIFVAIDMTFFDLIYEYNFFVQIQKISFIFKSKKLRYFISSQNIFYIRVILNVIHRFDIMNAMPFFLHMQFFVSFLFFEKMN